MYLTFFSQIYFLLPGQKEPSADRIGRASPPRRFLDSFVRTVNGIHWPDGRGQGALNFFQTINTIGKTVKKQKITVAMRFKLPLISYWSTKLGQSWPLAIEPPCFRSGRSRGISWSHPTFVFGGPVYLFSIKFFALLIAYPSRLHPICEHIQFSRKHS